jgi:sec-independent protein translocase protein TatA
MTFGTTEMLVVLAIVMLLFGAKRIPELMRGMGEGVRSFKEGMRTDTPTEKAPPATVPPSATAQEKK